MKHIKLTLITLAISAWPQLQAIAQHGDHHIEQKEDEEVFVVSSPLEKSSSETAIPVTRLDGEALRESVSHSLGNSLKNIPGINSASFGPGVGTPVIRGQSGNRVMVLSNGQSTADASGQSGDHANSVEPLVATGIEIIKGPATLLYGSGAIGGVVNVLDNRIPSKPIENTKFGFEQKHDTVNDGNTSVVVLEGGADSFAWHIDGSYKNTRNVSIPGYAIREEGHDEEEEEEEGHDEEEEENTFGFIGNSDLETSSISVGGSWINNKDYVGLSIGYAEKDYGLPPGAHGHEEEGHDEEGEEGGLEEEEGHDEEEEVVVRIDMEETRVDLKGKFHFDNFWESFAFHLSGSNYEHTELEIDEAHEEEEGELENPLLDEPEDPTVFSNDAYKARLELVHGSGDSKNDWHGALGLELSISEFGTEGSEAYIPKSDIESLALFLLESVSVSSDWAFEFGARAETQSVEPDSCGEDHSSLSLSGASIWKLNDSTNFSVGLSHSERAPSVEELFSNIDLETCEPPLEEADLVEHAATGLFEIGNANLDNEVSNNIEIGLIKEGGTLHGEVNFFYNQVSDYIFLLIDAEDEDIATYEQEDASFTGFEFEAHYVLKLADIDHLDFKLHGDSVFAELDDGGNLPRIPPWKLGFEVAYVAEDWVVKVNTIQVAEQDEVAEGETTTDGYTDLSIYGDYHWDFGKSSLVVFAKGTNLLDEEIRLHTSFVKDFAPEPGIGFELGLRYNLN